MDSSSTLARNYILLSTCMNFEAGSSQESPDESSAWMMLWFWPYDPLSREPSWPSLGFWPTELELISGHHFKPPSCNLPCSNRKLIWYLWEFLWYQPLRDVHSFQVLSTHFGTNFFQWILSSNSVSHKRCLWIWFWGIQYNIVVNRGGLENRWPEWNSGVGSFTSQIAIKLG